MPHSTDLQHPRIHDSDIETLVGLPAHTEDVNRLELRGIRKQYPGVLANDNIDLTVRRGEIHAILGENGAGKSTLMKIIYGATRADSGSMVFDGHATQLRNPQQARAMGIAMVFQHFNLFESLTVADNIWLGQDKSMSREMLRLRIEETSAMFGLDIQADRPVHTLSVGEMQRVEILRSLLNTPKLLILDEPTSVLTPQAVQGLFVVLRRLADQGCSILYISHKLHEIRQLCETCTVMRQGKVVAVVDPREHTNQSLSRLMIGSEPATLLAKSAAAQNNPVAFKVSHLSKPREHTFGVDLEDVNFEVKAGEIVGIAGISGNGQKELLYALSGESLVGEAESIALFDQPVGRHSPARRRAMGLHFVPEDRLGRGAVPSMDLAHNILLTRRYTLGPLGWISGRRIAKKARHIIERFNVKAAGPHAAAQSLSGGNLQKFIVGREIDAKPLLLILSQPTWGVDVGAATQIRSEIIALAENGCAVIVVSEEIDELFELSDRLYVMAKGRMSPSIDRNRASVEQIGTWMSGLWEGESAGGSGTAERPV